MRHNEPSRSAKTGLVHRSKESPNLVCFGSWQTKISLVPISGSVFGCGGHAFFALQSPTETASPRAGGYLK